MGEQKIGYLTGETKEPAPEDPGYSTWDAENSMVITWLVNSMEEEINSNYMCYHTVKELWDNINIMYSDLDNQSQVFELTLQFREIHQDEETVTKYFNYLKSLWRDLGLLSDESRNHQKITITIRKNSRIVVYLSFLLD